MNITEALKAAGWTDTAISMASEQEMQRMERFAQIIRNQALEEAAKVCSARAAKFRIESPHNFECNSLADAIRSMKKDQQCP